MSIKRFKLDWRAAGTQTSRKRRATLKRGPSAAADRLIAAGDGFAGAFFDGGEDVHGEGGDGFAEAAGPPDFDRVHAGVGAEAGEHARVFRGAVAHAAFGLVGACEGAGGAVWGGAH